MATNLDGHIEHRGSAAVHKVVPVHVTVYYVNVFNFFFSVKHQQAYNRGALLVFGLLSASTPGGCG